MALDPGPGDDLDDDDDGGSDDEQDLLLVFPLQKGQMGTRQEREAIESLEDELEVAVMEAGVGEFDGDEYGGGECTLFFCGPDVDKMLAIVRPLVKQSSLGRGAAFVRMVDDGDGGFVQKRSML